MSQIKELKENPEHIVNLVEVLQIMYPDSKTKYYDMLCRIIKNEIRESRSNRTQISDIQAFFATSILELIKKRASRSGNLIQKFIEYNEKNLIEENDLSTYKKIIEIENQVKRADEIEEMKKLESQVIKVFENDEWIVIKPTTHQSSVKYGYGSRWCTAMTDRSSYFNDYASTGVLIYCINKKKRNNSIAVYKKIGGELSFWNSNDTKIDSIETDLPYEIMDIIKVEIKSKKSNAQCINKTEQLSSRNSNTRIIDDMSIINVTQNVQQNDTYRRALEIMRRYTN